MQRAGNTKVSRRKLKKRGGTFVPLLTLYMYDVCDVYTYLTYSNNLCIYAYTPTNPSEYFLGSVKGV